MKKVLLFLPLIIFSLFSQAQLLDPVDWTMEVRQISAEEHELVFKATIDPGWHLYSQFIAEGGPIPTSFNFENIDGYEVIGKATEVDKPETENSAIFNMELLYFSKKATFIQKVKRLKDGAKITGFIEYMACDDERCTPPTAEDFSFTLNAEKREERTESREQGGEKGDAGSEKGDAGGEMRDAGGEKGDAGTEQAAATDDAPQAAESGIFEPVKWIFGFDKIDEQTYQLNFTANIDQGWKIYSQHIKEGGPIPTSFTFKEGNYTLVGDVTESDNVVKKQDKVFNMELAFFNEKAVFSQKVSFPGAPESIAGELTFMTCDEERCLPPAYVDFGFEIAGKVGGGEDVALDGEEAYLREGIDLKNPVSDCKDVEKLESAKGFWGNFVKGLLGGMIALITPCVFPMIPLTVSFFTKGGTNKKAGIKNASIYGLSIVGLYTLISVPFHIMENLDRNILNTMATDPILNFFFFFIFIFFAISFFGYFDLTLPSGLVNKISSKSSSGGLLGIFFMAITLTLVSFSCTGPILGLLLGESIQGASGAMNLTAGMLGFGVALGLPFALFAAFPSWLNSLPQSGGWMNTVKVVLGFIEVGLAIKFFSNADLVLHLGLLKRELFFGLWVATAVGLSAYLLGFIKFPHDPPKIKLTATRVIPALASLAFAVYLIPGLYCGSGKTFKLLSGFPPPTYYSYCETGNCPLDLACFKDYEEGMAYAKKVNKPVMLDFTGWACVNCRKMEENVWVEQEIFKRLNNDFVLISLYVDDREKLENPHEVIIPQTGQMKRIRTVGDKWATLQTFTFNNNSQPYYAIISPDEVLLNSPVGYTPDESEYRNFLDCGLEAYEKLQNSGISQK